jgi:hypothetical protein
LKENPHDEVRSLPYLSAIFANCMLLRTLRRPVDRLSIVMFNIPTYSWVRPALNEEKVVEADFGDEYLLWAALRPRFIPRLSTPLKKATA